MRKFSFEIGCPGGSVIVFDSWAISCEFDPGSRKLLGERGSTLSLTLAELIGLQLPSLGVLSNISFNLL